MLKRITGQANQLKQLIKNTTGQGAAVIQDENGQAMAEYGLIIALIAVVVIVALVAVGRAILAKFNDVNDALQ